MNSVVKTGNPELGPPDPDDQRLMELVREGQESALAELFARHHQEIFGFLVRMTRDRDLSADLAQEVFLRAWKHRASYRALGSPRAWLFQIARNLRADARRRGDRDSRLERALEPTEVDPGPEPMRRLMASEKLGTVSRAIARLPEAQREALLLAKVQEISHAELSELLGCSVGTLRVRICRALTRLRELVREEEGGRDVA